MGFTGRTPNAYKELMASKKTVKNLEFLKSIHADFFNDPTNHEFLDEWNHLQKTPPKTRMFTFATKISPKRICKYLEQNYPFNREAQSDGTYKFISRPQAPYYAYIKHDKDRLKDGEKFDLKDMECGEHYHFFLEYPNARSFASVATELGIPVTLLNNIKISKSAILQYLTHENNPKKFHYSPEDIHANFNVIEARNVAEFDYTELWYDVWAMCEGSMTRSEFLLKYNSYCATLSFTQNVRLAMDVYKATESNDPHNFARRAT